MTKRPLKLPNIDCERFVTQLNEQNIRVDLVANSDLAASYLGESLYNSAYVSRSDTNPVVDSVSSNSNRWERLIEENDQAKIWQAINWRGEIMDDSDITVSKPTDDEFKDYFDQIFSPSGVEYPGPTELHTEVYMPLLDNSITPDEVVSQISKLKPNKACGPDGIPPGIFKFLPADWIMFITTLFNNTFLSGSYPDCWTSAKLLTIFKRGSKSDPGNYRGINIINGIAKIYDMVLSARLSEWFIPYREQAVSQAGRGCMDHVVTLRLLMDVARRKKMKLFVTFIDFSKAYDSVPRYKLFLLLKQMGCGMTMLLALVAMYRCTSSVIGTAIVAATIGVRQGSPTSCILFVLYVNVMIKMLKQGSPVDGFLSWLHIMVMMDDTILLSTSREGMLNKIKILYEYCSMYGMIVNNSKTKFMVVNGSQIDKEPLVYDHNIINYVNQYIYLGSPFTDDGSPSTAIKIHASNKLCHALKFISFVNKNNDIPFLIKKKVFDAALMSAILYGSELWLNGNLQPIDKLYKWCIKQLLGVRKSTTNDVYQIELGMPPESSS